MDGRRFDALAKLVAASSSRRTLLGAAGAAITAAALGRGTTVAVACRGAGRLCGKAAHCCSDLCDLDADGRRRCLCPEGTERCRQACLDPAVGFLTDPDNCGACGARCRSGVCLNGVCGKTRGEACAADSECGSGFCVDELCCDRACDGQCESCADRGRCQVVTGSPPKDRPPCQGEGACAAVCDGLSSSCVYPGGGTICAPSTCDAGVQTDHVCDGAGACVATETDCGLFACGGDICRTSCADDDGCIAAAHCDGGHCVNDLPLGSTCGRSEQCDSGACCADECIDATTDDNCGSCGHVCSGLANLCLGATCDCEQASVCRADGLDPDYCLRNIGVCVATTEGQLACTDIRECGQVCTTSADCPTSSICSSKWGGGTRCSSTWVCTDSTCCGKRCSLVVPRS